MAQYAFNNTNAGTQQNCTTAFSNATSCVWSVTAATGATTLRRGWIYEFEVGADAVPNASDCPISWDISTQTAAGTATTTTPLPLDIGGGDAAALLVYNVNYTAAPTVTASSSLFYLALNQRASQRWIARDEKSAIIVPAVNLKGAVGRIKSPVYTATVGWQVYINE